jgi:hypothetical protein
MVEEMAKSKRSHSRSKKRNMRRSRRSGGGWTDGLAGSINPGNLVHAKYSGPGMDCAGVPMRYGYISGNLPGRGGLPGMMGGASQLGSGGPVGPIAVEQGMRGGRYGVGDMAPLNPVNGVGVSPAPFVRVPCETGTTNPMNPDMALQKMSTAVGWVPGWSKTAGGARRTRRSRRVGGAAAADMMVYEAPTAGYTQAPLVPAVPGNPGIEDRIGYPARAFSQACLTTGGPLVRGGASPVAAMAGKFMPVTAADYAGGVLPVKWGGAAVPYPASQLPMTPGMPVAAQAGPAVGEQRIPVIITRGGKSRRSRKVRRNKH